MVPEGPAYKALIINNITYLNPSSAEAILQYAIAGLPVVVVGEPPSKAQSYTNGSCNGDSGLTRTFSTLLGLNNSAQVSSESDAPAALLSLGVLYVKCS